MPDMLGWLRRHRWQADGLLAVAISSGQWQWQGQSPAVSPAAVTAVSVLTAATVVPRRRYPVAMFAAAVAIGAAQIALSVEPAGQPPQTMAGLQLGAAIQPTLADTAILVLLYTLAAHRSRRASITGLVICLLGSAADYAELDRRQGVRLQSVLFW